MVEFDKIRHFKISYYIFQGSNVLHKCGECTTNADVTNLVLRERGGHLVSAPGTWSLFCKRKGSIGLHSANAEKGYEREVWCFRRQIPTNTQHTIHKKDPQNSFRTQYTQIIYVTLPNSTFRTQWNRQNSNPKYL